MTEINYEGRDLEVLGEMPNYYAWIMETFAPHVRGHVIEYGAGVGTVSALLAPLSHRLTLVEPSPNLIEPLRRRFAGDTRVEIGGETIESHAARQGDGSFDTIVLINVLEHIDDDRAALGELTRMLRPDGRLLVFVPALSALMSRLDLMHGHLRRYRRAELIAKTMDAGGEILHCRYFDFAGVVPWFILNKVLGFTTFNPALVQFNDRAVVPISRAVERAISPPFGKNLVMVARKH
jgi:SAM-dependent methyltransferase